MAWYADVTVGTGKDHATLVAFEAAYDGENISATDGVRGKCTGIVTTFTVYWAGWQAGQTSSCKIVIIPDGSGEYTNGKDAGTGAEINHYQRLDQTTEPICIDFVGLEFSEQVTSLLVASTGANNIVRVAKCLFIGTGDLGSRGIYVASSGTTTLNIGGCVFRSYTGTDVHGYIGVGVYTSDDDCTGYVYNCTFDGFHGAAIYEVTGNVTVKNCAAINCVHADYRNCTETTNKSENDGTCTDDDADDFTEPSSYDYHVFDTSSALYHTGTQITDDWFDTELCVTDFDGTTWNNPPSIGAYEYVAAAGGSILPLVAFGTLGGNANPMTA